MNFSSPSTDSFLSSYLIYRRNKTTISLLKSAVSNSATYRQTLNSESLRFQEELKRIRSFPLSLSQFGSMVDENYAIIHLTSYFSVLSRVMASVDRDLLVPNATVAINRNSNAVIGVIPSEATSEVVAAESSSSLFTDALSKEEVQKRMKKGESFELGGYEAQQREIYEAMELPLLEPMLYRKLGIDPPKGVLMYGPPGTGKTLAARAVAARSNLPFIKVVASEFVQKYLGEGPRMVRDLFRLAREKSPCMVFIDEIDAIGQKRFNSNTGADREIQRILMELLTQIDGFDNDGNVKIMMATNRIDTLDPALLRPGRLDRKIEFGYPDKKGKRLIFNLYMKDMGIAEDVVVEELAEKNVKITGADIKAICREAGILAVREGKYKVGMKEFETAFENVTKNISIRTDEAKHEFYK